MFPMNAWYVACTPDEVVDKPLGRTICGLPIVLYRGAEGRVAALEDFCPHRGAALSLGSVVDGNLMCSYHGLVMDCHGKAVSMPMQRVGGFPCIRSYPVEERHGFVWIWPGEPALAGSGGIHADPAKRVSAIVVDFMTPETESSHWYFWGMARHFKPDDEALTESIRTGQSKIFNQDLAVLEAQQRNRQAFSGRRLLALNIDSGGVRANRILDDLVAAERAAPPEAAVG